MVVTHHHVDHAGTAETVRSRGGAEVLVGADDAPIVRGERPSHPPHGFWHQAWRPSTLGYLFHSARAGGARYRPIGAVKKLEAEGALDLPARPRTIPTPGHTAGHCSVLLEERGVLLSGDAMVNFDYASGDRGLSLHRFNEDRAGALAALDRLDRVERGNGTSTHSRKAVRLDVPTMKVPTPRIASIQNYAICRYFMPEEGLEPPTRGL